MSKYVKVYEKDSKVTKFVEQSDVMIDIAMASNMKEIKVIVREWKDDLAEVEQYRRDNMDTSSGSV